MKKLTVFAASIIAAFGLSAQIITNQQSPIQPMSALEFKIPGTQVLSSHTRGSGSSPSAQSFGDTLFAETFSNGLNGEPGNGSWTNAGNANWEYRGTSTNPDITTGSRGAFVGTFGPINSPTHSNGFMIFDSDYLDNGGNQAAMGNGPNPAPHEGYLETPTMDFTGYTEVYLQMSSFFRRYLGLGYVTFSKNGGTTWPDTLVLYSDQLPFNFTTQNAENISIPIPQGVGGNNNVKARFIFDGTLSNINGAGYYFWQIDDVYFIEAPDNDLTIDDISFTSPHLSGFPHSNNYYGQIPTNQAASDTMRFNGILRNKGKTAQSNSQIVLYVNNNPHASTVSTTIAPNNGVDSVWTTNTVPLNMPQGRYAFSYVAASAMPDDYPDDDTVFTIVDITDTAYSWVSRDLITDVGTHYPIPNYDLGSLIHINAPDTVTSFDFYVSNAITQNTNIRFVLWEIGQQGMNPVVQSPIHIMTPAMQGSWVNFDAPDTPINSGQYLLGFEAMGDTVFMGLDASPKENSFTLIEFGSGYLLASINAPAIQLNVKGNSSACSPSDHTSSTINESTCQSYTSPSTKYTWTTSGTYMDTIPNSIGCDSIITINLTINDDEVTQNVTSCTGSYTWSANNQTYTSSGTYTATLTNIHGCDSVITLNLTFGQNSSSTESVTACDHYTSPSGNYTWNTDGTYTDTVINASGCDSVITVNLTILNGDSIIENISTCASYTWPINNQTYTSSGTYSETFTNVIGCDSVHVLNLTINDDEVTQNITTCESSYTWATDNQTYNSSGTYTATLTNIHGCDSVITLELIIESVDVGVTHGGQSLTADATGASYQWLDCNDNYSPIPGAVNRTFTPNANGDYAVEVTGNNCTDTSACYNVTGTGIAAYDSKNEIIAYPNPTGGDLTIDLGSISERLTLEIRDITGRLLQSRVVENTRIVNLNINQPAGIYLIHVIPDGERDKSVAVIKVIKK